MPPLSDSPLSDGAPQMTTSAREPAKLAQPPAPPEGSKHARVACRCLNVELDAHVDGEASGTVCAWIAAGSEKSKLREYVGDNDGARTCWACGSQLYRPLPDGTVEIDFDQVLTGAALGAALHEQTLPFSGLLLSIPSTSTFGRPPPAEAPSIYPSGSDAHAPALLPPLADPFFLPPPFVPAHPHLRDLCRGAEAHLAAAHARIEDDVRAYIAARAREMRALEDAVRAEVELLWARYAAGPARDDGAHLERTRSASMSRSTEIRPAHGREGFAAPRDVARTENPPAVAVVETRADVPAHELSPSYQQQQQQQGLAARAPAVTGAGTSLLSASLSANAFFAPPPGSRPPPDNDLFEQLTHRAETGVEREVAMSHVLSAIDELSMGGRRERAAASTARTRTGGGGTEGERVEGEEQERDSWIGMERGQVANAEAGLGRNEERAKDERAQAQQGALEPPAEDDGGRTPRARQVKGLHSERKARVKFEEPVKERRAAHEDADDDYVFDFDMADIASAAGAGSGAVAQPAPHAPVRPRPRNVVESELSRTFAADAPSHRAAWRRLEDSGDLYSALRRGPAAGRGHDDDDGDDDDDAVAAFATSMPVDIARPRRAATTAATTTGPNADVPRQRKTSFTAADDTGRLVPALLGAMRERPAPNSLGLTVAAPAPARRTSDAAGQAGTRTPTRRARTSHSREREAAPAYTRDAGAVFEVFADADGVDAPESDDDDADGFVPPHVLARRESDRLDVGWRSLAS
ncbi:hypothetical protein Q5752_001017 [Cryptotrichosporon argae]